MIEETFRIDEDLHDFPDKHPATVQEAIDVLDAVLTEEQKDDLVSTPQDRLSSHHFFLGRWIRNNFGLWSMRSALRTALGNTDPDAASAKLIERYWQNMQTRWASETPKLPE